MAQGDKGGSFPVGRVGPKMRAEMRRDELAGGDMRRLLIDLAAS